MTLDCPICKKDSPLYFSTRDFNRNITSKSFNYYRCSLCNLIFLSPIPHDLEKYYHDGYYSVPSSLSELANIAELEHCKIEIVKQFASGGKLLEIGAARGSFVYLAKQAGFLAEAIEMDQNCCTFIQQTIGVKAVQSNDPANALKDMEHYDVIALWQVIEHLPDPWSVLDEACNKLKSGGILLIAAPNPSALNFRIFGRYWVHVDAPRHLQLIPMQVLRKYMKSRGMHTVMSTTTDEASAIFSTFGWWSASLLNILKDIAPFLITVINTAPMTFIKKSNDSKYGFPATLLSALKSILFFPLRLGKTFLVAGLHLIFTLIVRPIERIDKLGCTYTMVFKK